jgi:primosomal protein N' (replication factor Y)
MALVRGKLEKAQVILGSATPSLESYQNAITGRFEYLEMPDRVFERPMPAVELVDLRRRGHEDEERRSEHLSERLIDALQQTFDNGQQAILFLNRRGYSPCVVCEVCGHVWRCPNCDVSLTYHRRQEALRCHHCDHSIRLPEICPECSNHSVGPRGIGTEQLEGHLKGLFPGRRIARLDRDTSRGKRLQALIRRFSNCEIDLLVGTQMVTKGHDFPGVTTVGVVLADIGLNFPDLRGAERTFQLLTQVAGRAGRGEEPGRVFVQTYSPEHYALEAAREHDYQGFAAEELTRRELFAYPPFGYLVALKFEAPRESQVASAARDYLTAARRRLRSGDFADAQVKGPAPSPFERLRGKTRWQMLLQSTDRSALRRLVGSVLHDVGHFDPEKRRRNTNVVVDIDPINML